MADPRAWSSHRQTQECKRAHDAELTGYVASARDQAPLGQVDLWFAVDAALTFAWLNGDGSTGPQIAPRTYE